MRAVDDYGRPDEPSTFGITQWAQYPQDYDDGNDPEVIDKWIQQLGNAALIEAAGDSWIKPRETLSEYSYVRGATHEVAIESDRVKQPSRSGC